MKPNKPDKNVAGMDVLKDIRGLLSTSKDRKTSTVVDQEEGIDYKRKAAQYEEEIKRYREQFQKQQEELASLTKENQELVHKLELIRSGQEEIPYPAGAGVEELTREIAQLEQRKADLDRALSEVMDLLLIKLKELLKRIATIFQEAGEQSMVVEFRKGADSLETAENLARFLQILIEK